MKKIFILAASVLFISSCNMKKSNSEQALQDSIRVADSIAVLEYEKEQAMYDEIQAGILLTPISNQLLAPMANTIL